MRWYPFLSALALCVSFSMASSDYDYLGSTGDTTVKAVNYNGGTAIAGDASYTFPYTGGIGVKGYGNHGVEGFGWNNYTSGTGVYGSGDGPSSIGVFGTSLSNEDPTGVKGFVDNGATGIGVVGEAYSEIGSATGVQGLATGPYAKGVEAYATGSVDVYGIYSTVDGGEYQSWAGYFNGDVYVSGTFVNPSDIMFKKNVRNLDGGLSKIMALKPKSYQMKTEEFKGRVNLPKGDKFGLIAQDVEFVLPDLVHPVTAPAQVARTKDGKLDKNAPKGSPTKFKSVDYLSLIPILVQAIQEQQAEIEALKKGK